MIIILPGVDQIEKKSFNVQEILGTISGDPSISKSKRLHAETLGFA